MGKKGRSVKAVRALLDVDALKSSKDRTTDIDKALEEAAKANPWAFGEATEGGSVHVSSGAEHGTPPPATPMLSPQLQGNEPRHQDRLIERKYYGTRSTGSLFQAG